MSVKLPKKISVNVNLNVGATIAVVVPVTAICATVAYVASRPNSTELFGQIPSTVSQLPSVRHAAEERRPSQLRSADDVA